MRLAYAKPLTTRKWPEKDCILFPGVYPYPRGAHQPRYSQEFIILLSIQYRLTG